MIILASHADTFSLPYNFSLCKTIFSVGNLKFRTLALLFYCVFVIDVVKEPVYIYIYIYIYIYMCMYVCMYYKNVI